MMDASGFIGAHSARRATAILGVLLLAGSAWGQDPPSTVDLSVVIRDFSRDHPDFNVVPTDGYGYYAGNVALDLDDDGRPVFTGGGFRAQALWKDVNGHPIAPHLYNTCAFLTPIGGGGGGLGSFGLVVDEKLEIDDESVIDSFDSNLGPYGRENALAATLVRANGTGAKLDSDEGRRWWKHKGDDKGKHSRKGRFRGHLGKPIVEVGKDSTIKGDVMVGPGLDLKRAVQTSRKGTITGAVGHLEAAVEMPEPAAPELGPSVGEVEYKRGEHTLSADLHCEKLKLKKGAVLNIEGDVTILCDEKLELKDRAEIRLMPESTLTLVVGEKIKLKRGAKINMNTGNPQLVSIAMLGVMGDDDDDDDGEGELKSKVDLDRSSQMAAWVQGASTELKVDNRSEFFGAFMGREVEVDDHSRLHVDMATSSGGGTVI